MSFNRQLILEATSIVADSTFSITCHVGNLADLVEHVSTGKQENADDADAGPDVSVLGYGLNIGPGLDDSTDQAKEADDRDEPEHVVDGTLDGRLRSVRHVTSDPGVNLLGNLGTGGLSAEA